MFNAEKPRLDELPSSAQLIRSTAIAAVSAVVILVTVVLPAEYDIDPTGIGGAIGLAEMGEIKSQLAEEAEADRLMELEGQEESSLMNDIFGLCCQSFNCGASDMMNRHKPITKDRPETLGLGFELHRPLRIVFGKFAREWHCTTIFVIRPIKAANRF